jgi:hypothetical protein
MKLMVFKTNRALSDPESFLRRRDEREELH